MVISFNGVFHTISFFFFHILVIILFVRIILSWLQLRPGNPVMRFFSNIVDPMINPIAKRLPRMSFGMFDLGYTLAFFFIFWALLQVDYLVGYAMPANW